MMLPPSPSRSPAKDTKAAKEAAKAEAKEVAKAAKEAEVKRAAEAKAAKAALAAEAKAAGDAAKRAATLQAKTQKEEAVAVARLQAREAKEAKALAKAAGKASPHGKGSLLGKAKTREVLALFDAGPIGLGLANTSDHTAVAVTSVDAGLAAEAQGVRVGWLVREVNGSSVSGLDKAAVIALIKAATRPITIKFSASEAR